MVVPCRCTDPVRFTISGDSSRQVFILADFSSLSHPTMPGPQADDVDDNVTSLSTSPDGKQVAFGAVDGTLTLWDIDRRRQICPPIVAHQSIINSVCYSANGRLIASASDDQTIGLWDAITGQSLRSTFSGHKDGVLIVGFVTDARTVVSLSADCTVLVWEAATGEVEQQFRVSLDARSLATLSHDGEKLLAAHRRGVTIWNTITMESTKTIYFEGPAVLCMELSLDATKVAFGMADNSIHLWDIEKDDLDSTHLEGGKDLPLYVAWSPDGKTVSSVAQNAALRVWSVESGQCMSESYTTRGPITYSPGGRFIICPGDDGSPDIWEVPEMPDHSSTFLLDLPAAGVSMRHTTGAAESDTFWGVSGDVPVTNTHQVQRPRELEGPPGQNTPSRTKRLFTKALQRLSARGKESEGIAMAKYKNPVVVAPGTRRSVPPRRHVSVTQDFRTSGIPDSVSDESEVTPRRTSNESMVPGCLPCRAR